MIERGELLPAVEEDRESLGEGEVVLLRRGLLVDCVGPRRGIRVLLLVVGLYPFPASPSMYWAMAITACPSM